MKKMFFATSFFDILQVQNIIIELEMTKEELILILWDQAEKNLPAIQAEIEQDMFSCIECITVPVWPNFGRKAWKSLLVHYRSLSVLITEHMPDEIFIPDAESGFQLVQTICSKYNIKLSLYETGLKIYRYINDFDPNKRTFLYRLKKTIWLFGNLIKKLIVRSTHRQNQTNEHIIKPFCITLFYQIIPEIGRFFLNKNLRSLFSRIENVHQFLCTNPTLVKKLFKAEIITEISLNHLISNTQQMKIYAAPEFWEINPNHLFFFDQNYTILGVTPQQHALLVIKCLQSLGRIFNITIKPHISNTDQMVEIYKQIIEKKKYNIQIIASEAAPESIISVKKIRKMASLAGRSFVYTKIANPETRSTCLYKLYEEKAKALNLDKSVLEKIYQHHHLFEAFSNYSDKNLSYIDIENLKEPFFDFNTE
ncbi:MAG: polysialyltransferase family glycosyltransferase [Brevinemataceae bacterium]